LTFEVGQRQVRRFLPDSRLKAGFSAAVGSDMYELRWAILAEAFIQPFDLVGPERDWCEWGSRCHSATGCL